MDVSSFLSCVYIKYAPDSSAEYVQGSAMNAMMYVFALAIFRPIKF